MTKGQISTRSHETSVITINPTEYEEAIFNPLKGFRPFIWSDQSEASNPKTRPRDHELSTLRKQYIKWCEIENHESDGVEKITGYCNYAWVGVEKYNIKVIPRVYLQWGNDTQTHWPADMKQGDWDSVQFKDRLVKMIYKLGKAWDKDPRIAYIEMGIYGKWGEHHSPDIPLDIMKLMGDGFRNNFKNKLIMHRHPWDFTNYSFGIYWDSFAHANQNNHAEGILKLGDRWKTAVMGGECAYDWGNYLIQPGKNATDSVSDPNHREYIYHMIRCLHQNHLGWIDQYNQADPTARAGAAILQKAMGYRFVISEVKYPQRIDSGKACSASFTVKNMGSSPFYYNWPVEISLLHSDTKQPVWKDTFKNVDIRDWLPGDQWNSATQQYDIPAEPYVVKGNFTLPGDIVDGEYILTLALLDPAGELPSVRFAIKNYYHGGRHPIGKIGVGVNINNPVIVDFDDLVEDRSLYYKI